jgi:hypothetical protein
MRTLVVVVFVTAGLAACSSDGSDDDATTAAATTGTTTVDEAPPPPEQPGVAEDPDDADGPLDVRSVSAVRTGDLLAVSIMTYEPWDDDVLAGLAGRPTGPERLRVLYDTDLDGNADYVGEIVYAGEALSVFIAGREQAFEPVLVERPNRRTAQFVHPTDVFFVATGEGGVDSDVDIQVAVESATTGAKERTPDEGWIVVPFGP